MFFHNHKISNEQLADAIRQQSCGGGPDGTDSSKPILLVDVRSPGEVALGRIWGPERFAHVPIFDDGERDQVCPEAKQDKGSRFTTLLQLGLAFIGTGTGC